MRNWQTISLFLIVMLYTAPGWASGNSEHQHHGLAPAVATLEKHLQPLIPDTVLTDQYGNKHRFYTDLVKGKTVLINAVYTSCAGVCPIQTAVFSKVQSMLGQHVGEDVQMISVTLDPVTDTPERLREFADKFHVGPGWLFLTGSKQEVTEVLRSMDLYSPVPAQHTPIAAIGHEPGEVWMKVINVTAPADIVGRIQRVKELGEQRASR